MRRKSHGLSVLSEEGLRDAMVRGSEAAVEKKGLFTCSLKF